MFSIDIRPVSAGSVVFARGYPSPFAPGLQTRIQVELPGGITSLNLEATCALLSELIAARSVSGAERCALELVEQRCREWGWAFERIPVTAERWNIFIATGTPRVVFTTHIDVVPAPSALFTPLMNNLRIVGRGACDAKGALASMIAAGSRLRAEGKSDFGILVVVGEESDGLGARTSAAALRTRGIQYLIDGEPTECKLMRAHLGAVETIITCRGKACHSGYPELGVDANRALLEVLERIIHHSWPTHPQFGPTLVNVGCIEGGVASNVIADRAVAKVLLRSGVSCAEIEREIAQVVGRDASIKHCSSEPAACHVVSGFEIDIARYCSDIPNFIELGATPLLFGPGSIHNAHTDSEFVEISQLARATDGYAELYHKLS